MLGARLAKIEKEFERRRESSDDLFKVFLLDVADEETNNRAAKLEISFVKSLNPVDKEAWEAINSASWDGSVDSYFSQFTEQQRELCRKFYRYYEKEKRRD
jgi:hypothetical protein